MVCLRVPDWALLLPDSHHMIEARQREDATECDMGVNGAFLCHFDDLMYYSVTLNAHRSVQTHVYTGSACIRVHRLVFGFGLIGWKDKYKGSNWEECGRKSKKTKQNINMQQATTKKEPLLISCINIFKSENHLHKMMTLLLFYCLTSPQCLMWVLGFMGDVKIQFSGNLSAEETKPLSSIEH